jgi:hypothetical protein
LRNDVAKYLSIPEIIPFKDDSFTERGERVYTHLDVTVVYANRRSFHKVVKADKGIGFTEEWIEDTCQKGIEALERDFPDDVYKVVKVKPNVIRFEYVGPKGMVN